MAADTVCWGKHFGILYAPAGIAVCLIRMRNEGAAAPVFLAKTAQVPTERTHFCQSPSGLLANDNPISAASYSIEL